MKLPIVQKRHIFFTVSALLVLASIISLFVFGLKPGIDFTGGSLMEISFTGERPNRDEMQTVFDDTPYGNVIVQATEEKGYLLKMRFLSEEEHQDILKRIRDRFEVSSDVVVNDETLGMENASSTVATVMTKENKVLEERIETIGASISSHLKERAYEAAIAVMLAIVIYVAYAFRKVSRPVSSWKYGVTAIIALLHDVLITMGVFAILGKYFDVEVDIPFVVAMLTILGYSVNDTIVVFDRVRENLIKYGYEHFDDIVNRGVNETLVRSINTSATTLLVLFALFLFGGASIHYFSLALIIGIFFGTYSSIFLASPILVVWQKLARR